MLHITRRDCELDEKYSGKTIPAKEGAEETYAFKFTLRGVEMDREETNAFLDDPFAYDALYDTSKSVHRPMLKHLKRIEWDFTWKDAFVSLWYLTGDTRVDLKACKVTKVMFVSPKKAEDGVVPSWSFTIESAPMLDRKLVDLIERMGSGIECEIKANRPEDQQDLPLNQHGEGEQSESAGKKARGRKRNGHRPHIPGSH